MIRNQFGLLNDFILIMPRIILTKHYPHSSLSMELFMNHHVYTPHNKMRVDERKFGHFLAITKASLSHTNVPKQCWGEVVLTATYLINC